MRRIKGAAIAVTAGLLAAACGSSGKKTTPASPSATASTSASASVASGSSPAGSAPASTASHKQGGTVTISNTQGQTWTCQFNPFNPAVNQTAAGFVYEPLVYVNPLKNAAETPMLASSYKWSADKTSITFTTRDGVKWSDGQPFTAKDVAFTFNLMKATPSTDLYSLWTGAGLTKVEATDDKTVTLTFKAAALPYFFNFANQVSIVPEHIWSAADVKDQGRHVREQGTDRHRSLHGQPVHAEQDHLHRQQVVLAGGQALHPEGRVPGVPRQQPGQPRPGQRQGAVGRSVHPRHRQLLRQQGQGEQPLLVRAGDERRAVPEPRQVQANRQPGRA